MKILGVIAEYNPFHNGHALHLSQARARSGCDFTVALMSGNFVQRGEPAIIDKYRRTKMALVCGADMVLELPVYYATASAEYFAHNAVRIVNACGIINMLAFGSETGALDALARLAETLAHESDDYRRALRASLDNGEAFPRARAAALGSQAAAPGQPNDILGVEYIKAIRKIGAAIEPIAITRVGAEYHHTEINGKIASATAVRRAVLTGSVAAAARAMSAPAWDILSAAYDGGSFVRGLDAYADAFRYALLTHPRLDEVMDMDEGLENRFLEMSGKRYAPSEILAAVKTKRYTYTRLSRAALHVLLDIRRADFARRAAQDVPYIRVLGIKKTAGALMNALTANASCPVVTTLMPAKKALDANAWAMLEKEIATTDIYYLGIENKTPAAHGVEWREPFIVL